MENGIRMIALGGLGHIGLNAMVLDTPEGAYLLDCGVEFPDPNEPGVEQVIPDVTWLLGLGDHLKAVVLTHGHEDHIGGVAHLLKQRRLPVYGPRLAIALLEEKLEEHGIHGEVQLQIVEKTTTLSLEGISVEFLRVTHSIPDCFSLAIRTAEGTVVHTGDWKWDEEPVDGEEVDIERFTMLGDEGVALLLGDSTNAEVPGRTSAEVVTITPMDKGIVSRATKALLEMGYVRREASQLDGRLSHLHLTESGTHLYQDVIPNIQIMAEWATDRLTPTRLARLREDLNALMDVIPDLR